MSTFVKVFVSVANRIHVLEMKIENELNFRNKMNIILVLFLTLKYHQGSNFIPSVKHVGKKLNDSGRKDEMQNILNFKDDSMGYIPRMRQIF